MPTYDDSFTCLPSSEDEPESWCEVSSQFYLAAQQVLHLLKKMKEARVELLRILESLGEVSS